jgi:hypothetical protein
MITNLVISNQNIQNAALKNIKITEVKERAKKTFKMFNLQYNYQYSALELKTYVQIKLYPENIEVGKEILISICEINGIKYDKKNTSKELIQSIISHQNKTTFEDSIEKKKSGIFNISNSNEDDEVEIKMDKTQKNEENEVIPENETEEEANLRKLKAMCKTFGIPIPKKGEVTVQRLTKLIMGEEEPEDSDDDDEGEEKLNFNDVIKKKL